MLCRGSGEASAVAVDVRVPATNMGVSAETMEFNELSKNSNFRWGRWMCLGYSPEVGRE